MGKRGGRWWSFVRLGLQDTFGNILAEFKESPEDAIVRSCELCDAAVKREIECLLSGTSAVVMFLTESSIVVGSVGDAKAVLATTPSLTGCIPHRDVSEEAKKPSAASVNRRILAPARLLDAIQLTIDHKPNHSEELQRILENGGRVSRLTDDSGNKVGPHRVWKKNGHLPGLAASRSIGDKMASDLGVIPIPLTHKHGLRTGEDQFIVLASDGVWNVMGEEDVVNFVEKFRRVCPKVPPAKPIDPVKPSNSPISHLLSEEARLRWLQLVEAESVSIDDISCIVLELDGGSAFLSTLQPDDWTQKISQKPVTVTEGEEAIHFSKAADPLRGSMVLPSEGSFDLSTPPLPEPESSHPSSE